MSLVSFLNNLFKDDGFELIDSNSKKYVIGKPIKEKPIVIKLLDQKLMQKLLINPDLYFGEAYMDGSLGGIEEPIVWINAIPFSLKSLKTVLKYVL